MHLISIKGSMSFACLKSCLNHAMLNYEKIIQMNSKRQTKFQFKKKEKLKKQYNGEILVIHALLVAYIPLYFWTTENKGFFTLRSPAVWIWWFIAINDSSVAVRKLSNIFFSPSSSAFMKNFSPKTVRPMIPGYCFWWLGRGGGLLIVYSENAVIFFPNILELKSTYPKYRGAIYRYEASIKVKSWAPQSRGVRCDYIDAFSIWNIFSFVSVLDIVSN